MNNNEYLTVEYDIISSSIKEALSCTNDIKNFYKSVKNMYHLDFLGLRQNVIESVNKTKELFKSAQLENFNTEYNNFLKSYNNLSIKYNNEIIDPIDLFYNHMKAVCEEDLTVFQNVYIH